MKLPTRWSSTEWIINEIVKLLTNRVSIQENLQARVIDVLDSGPANTEFVVQHNLGKVPTAYLWNIDRSGIVYDSARNTWTDSSMKLKCSVPNAVLKIVAFY